MSDTINQRIALYRKMANLTQTEPAERMGMKYSTYSQMERKGNISAERLRALSEILGVKPEILLYGQEGKQNKELNFSAEKTEISNTLRQPSVLAENTPSFAPAPFVPNRKEENILKILRNLPKEDYDEVIALINKKYKASKTR